MAGIKLSLNRQKLILDTATKILNRSFNNLTARRKRKFVKHFNSPSSNLNFKDLEIERKLWNIEEQGENRPDRVVVRCAPSNNALNYPRIFAKAGLTREIESKRDYGLVISYGWNSDYREAGFERNVVTEMNHATGGVKMYYSTPGEKAAIGKLRRPTSMKNYLE